jgi:hypothetical protein
MDCSSNPEHAGILGIALSLMLRLGVTIQIARSAVSAVVDGQPDTFVWATPELEVDPATLRIVRIGQFILRAPEGKTDTCRPIDPATGEIIDFECLEPIAGHVLREAVSRARWPLGGLRLKPRVTVIREADTTLHSDDALLAEMMRRLGAWRVDLR